MIKAFIILSLILASIAFPALANNPLTEGIVPKCEGACSICDLWHLGDHIINFLLFGLAVPILTVMLIWGGVVWTASAGNPSQISRGKQIVNTGLIGVLIAFGAWVFIDTVIKTFANPDVGMLMSWNEFPKCVKPDITQPAQPAVAQQQPQPEGEESERMQATVSNEAGYQMLQDAGISVVSSGSCDTQTNPRCTSLEQMPSIVIVKLIEIKNTTGVDLKVTGGTEVGHQTHGMGLPVVDFKPENATSENYKKLLEAALSAGGNGFCETKNGGADPRCNPSGADPTDHIHASF